MNFVAPWLQSHMQNSLIIFHAEKAKLALLSEQQDLNLIVEEAMDTISPQYLSYVFYLINYPYDCNLVVCFGYGQFTLQAEYKGPVFGHGKDLRTHPAN